MFNFWVPVLPLRFERPLLSLAAALLVWLLLQLLGATLLRRQPWRGLANTSCLSVCITVISLGVGTWLLQLIPAQERLSLLTVSSLHSFLLICGAAWTLGRWRRYFRSRQSLFTDQLPFGLNSREKLFLSDVLDKLLGVSVFVLWLLAVLGMLGVSVTVLVTAGGLGAAAVAFGAQSVVSDSLTGFSLYLNKPFVVGDFIDIPSETLAGEVEKIGWFYTQLRTYDRQPVFIPNAIFGQQSVINVSQIDNRRLIIAFSVTYSDRDRIPAICAELTDRLRHHPLINPAQDLLAVFSGYGASSLDCQLICCATTSNRVDALHLQHDLLLLIGDVVERYGASMPFPTRTLVNGDIIH
ncbi:mechanosensitive ion channel protein MscS [cyanobiont of Ornithocercus magnificus]|nr:mechanosensitive ion channel protein MscS [cyanobiont of Ornithocercus magnificus]